MVLNNLRIEIDEINKKIIDLLEKRMNIARAIAKEKKLQGLEIKNISREKKMMDDIIIYSKGKNLKEEMITDIFENIIKHTINEEQR